MFLFLSIILLSISMLVLLWRMLRKTDTFEGLFLYLFCAFICQHINFKIFSAYDRLSVTQEFIPRVISYLHFGIIFPVLLVGLVYAFRSQTGLVMKGILSLLWISFDVLSKWFYLKSGFLESKSESWYPTVDILTSVSLIILSLLFMKQFHSILRRERVLR